MGAGPDIVRPAVTTDAIRHYHDLLTPAIAAAALKGAWEMHKEGGIPPGMMMPFIVGIIVSGITGALVIGLLLNYLRRHGLWFFIYYRIIFGIIVIALATFFRYTGG